MKLVTYDAGAGARAGILTGETVVDAAAALGRSGSVSMLDLLAEGLGTLAMRLDVPGVPLSGVRLLAPIPRPGKIVGIGRNYGAHQAEGGLAKQEQPRLFFKAATSVIGPGVPIRKPVPVAKLDWEVEVAVVVGSVMRDVPEDRALDYVAGYTIMNDVSAREFQFDVTPPQTSFAKSMDGFAPVGPWLVTAEEVGDSGALDLRCWVNGALMQEGNTHDLIFPIPYLLSYVSRYLTLEPGDLIATGTPAGVGAFRDPPVFLRPGDRIRMEVEKLGVLENTVA